MIDNTANGIEYPHTEISEQSAEARESRSPIPVIAFGASAGGLDVFKRLLGDLPSDTGFAIVFLQHLDPNHNSLLAEILARATVMPVHEVVDGIRLEPNHIYVMPANVTMTIESGALKLAPRAPAPELHVPIDRFLSSMADQCGNRAIGVILSGTGSDGSAGLEAVKAAGGVTFAQEAASAKFPSMPQAAAATGCVDFVLPPDGIAAEIVRIGRDPYITDANPGEPPPAPSPERDPFGKILATLQLATGIDFSVYRQPMVNRRILRRLALSRIGSITEYADRLPNDSDELKSLHRDLLISVTNFFRDKDSFEFLRTTVFPRLLQGRSLRDPIRVWVAGCATGEEALTIAILLQEYLKENAIAFPVQIFASDINEKVIEKARSGKYAEHIAADLSHEMLNRHFTKIDGGYQVNKSLREMCIFAKHNLIKDPPFSNLDLITCRNVLIYLGSVQKDIISLFHYALKPAGFLMLGAAEGAAENDLFFPLDGDHRIYAKLATAKKLHAFPRSPRPVRSVADPNGASAPSELWRGADSRKEVDGILLSKYSPAGVVLDENLEVLEIRGNPSPYLTLPLGKISFHLMKLIPETGLFLDAEKLIRQALKSGEPARQESIAYEHEGNSGFLNLEAVPLHSTGNRSTLLLLEPIQGAMPAVEPAGAPGESDVRDRQISGLKQQLADAKERFLFALEAQQASKEESQNTTEEALSTNEELQSLNEELETAKEELQSTNEELTTVNDELQAKNAALANSRDFAMSIVETVRQPLLVLDTEMRITMANRAFYRTFQTSPVNTEGQIVYSLVGGSWDLPGLRDALDSLRRGASSFPDFEVEGEMFGSGRKNLMLGGCRINDLQMILLAVDDVTGLKMAQQTRLRTEEHLRQSQKLEAVGRLAGGIAHDFNNLLTAIIGYSSLLQVSLGDNEDAVHQVIEIKNAGAKAAALTQQLLAFSRRQVLQPKVLDLNAIVADFERMLRRLVGERIVVEMECDAGVWRVRVDPGEFGRVLMNLSLNARDAMPVGGRLTIRTSNVIVTDVQAASLSVAPGRYVTLAVHDTGVGMDCEAKRHIFEPFFTTKETGKGTGLGLATVLGIVEQSGGAIVCESEMGEGTVFKIYVPAVTDALDDESPPEPATDGAPKGSEVILLVEDEDMVRKLARMVLQASGYEVYEARNGREGLAFCESHQGPIDLLLSDVVMPELGGREMAEAAVLLCPKLKVLFMSGHTQDVVLKEGVRKGAPFLQKPFTATALAQKVRDTLDSQALSAGHG